ncbi:hypothetical protein N8611_00475, partial [bacterium]|nr:hypothetical protein [bacterium]
MEPLGGKDLDWMESMYDRFSYWLTLRGRKATALLSHSKTWRRGVHAAFILGGFVSLGAADFSEKRDRLSFSSNASEGETLRVMSWNVKAGALFPASMRNPLGEEVGARVGRFGRIL